MSSARRRAEHRPVMVRGPVPRWYRRLAWLGVAISLVAGCKVVPPKPPSLVDDLRRVEQTVINLPTPPPPAQAPGSLWTDYGIGMALFRDTRAFRVNDLVTIRLAENDTGRNQADTDLARTSTADIGVTSALGLEKANPTAGKLQPQQLPVDQRSIELHR